MSNWYTAIVALILVLPAQCVVASPNNEVVFGRSWSELGPGSKIGADDTQMESCNHTCVGATRVVAQAGAELRPFAGRGAEQKTERVYFGSFDEFRKFYAARLKYHDDGLIDRGLLGKSIVALVQFEGVHNDPQAAALATPICGVELKTGMFSAGEELYTFLRDKLTDVTNTPPSFAAPQSWGIAKKVYQFGFLSGVLTGGCKIGDEVLKRLNVGGRVTEIVNKVNAARQAELKDAYQAQKTAEDQKMEAQRA